MLTNIQISEFLMNSDKIAWIVTEFLAELWRSKVRFIRSLADRTLQLSSQRGRVRGAALGPDHAGRRRDAGARGGAPRITRGPSRRDLSCKVRSARDRINRTFERQNSERNSITIQEILSEFIRNSEIWGFVNIKGCTLYCHMSYGNCNPRAHV